jgi:hypothetical protein
MDYNTKGAFTRSRIVFNYSKVDTTYKTNIVNV